MRANGAFLICLYGGHSLFLAEVLLSCEMRRIASLVFESRRPDH